MSWLVSLEGVPSAFTATRDGIDALLRDRGLRRTTPEQTATSLLRGAHASAVLEGSTSTFEEVAEGAGDAIAVDAVRVSTELLSLVPVLGRAPLQALARIHAVASASSLPEERRGRPRDAASAERLRSLSDALLAETAAPALMVAALAHADLATAAPFPSHNGIVARAAERLVLVGLRLRRGLRHPLLAALRPRGLRLRRGRLAAARLILPTLATGPGHAGGPRGHAPEATADTRRRRLPGVHHQLAAAGASRLDRHPVGRVDRRVGTSGLVYVSGVVVFMCTPM